MKGSGLDDAMGVLFGPNTVEHIFTGKAYARAVRGHFLIQKALTDLLLDYLKGKNSIEEVEDNDVSSVPVSVLNENHLFDSLKPSTAATLNELYTQTLENGFNNDDESVLQDPSLLETIKLLDELKCVLSEQSRTARLWLYYMKCLDIVKLFLAAERTGNWLLHWHVVHKMLTIFAATGHANYAKCGRIYLQQMHDLPETHPTLHKQFLNGYHTVRRSDRFGLAYF
jgi:hypothetical protein